MPITKTVQVSELTDLNKFIGLVRSEEKLSQEVFGNKVGVSKKQTLWNWESGNRAIGFKFLLKIAKAFGYKIVITLEKDGESAES